MSEITALGYIGIRSSHLEDWSAFATDLVGMQRVDGGRSSRQFRMDDRRQRLVVSDEGGEGLGVLGWEVADAAGLDALAAKLESHGVAVVRGSAALADERHVAQLIVFHDPAGNRLEASCGPEMATDKFSPGRPVTGFKTGPLGMGHVVLNVADVEPLLPFYRDILGFRVSDFGHTPYKLYFFHVNGRHHSFAMVGSGRTGLHHFMVELFSIDDVGQGYDLAQMEEGRVAYTLGRHSNDYVTSFYATTPSGFFVEYGWNGRVIEPESWVPHETFDGPSLWGHERLHMDEAGRKRLRDMRLSAAAKGVRAPVDMPDCPWLDSVIARE